MRIYSFIICFGVMTLTKAQLLFSNTNTLSDNSSVLMAFGTDTENKRGLILPSVKSLPEIPKNGTFLVDDKDQKVKVYTHNQWMELSDTEHPYKNNPNLPLSDQEVDGVFVYDTIEEETKPTGVLELNSKTKAFILPLIQSPHLNVIHPTIGFICYDTDAQMMALFDGYVWHYWK